MWSLFYFFLYIVLVLPGSTRIHCIWPDPDPGKEIEVVPDPDPRRGLKWIRIRPNAVDPGGSGSDPDPKRCKQVYKKGVTGLS